MAREDAFYMQRAIELAYTAEADGEVPVGALVVYDDEIIAEGFNRPITTHDPGAHAEMLALRQAGLQRKNYRLLNTTLYVTLEPCAMCASAMLHARVNRCVFGAFDPKAGACGSRIDIFKDYAWNHRIESIGGVLESECAELLKQFFKKRR